MSELIRHKHLKITFFGSSDEEAEGVAISKIKDVEKIVSTLNKDVQLAKVTLFTGGYGGTMNMVAQTFSKGFTGTEILCEIVGVVSKIYGTSEDSKGLPEGHSDKISEFNNRLIWTENIQDRTNVLIEAAPNIFVLPGKQGTFIELLLAGESARLNSSTGNKSPKRFFIDIFWRDVLLKSNFLRKSYYNESKGFFFIDYSGQDFSYDFSYDELDKEIGLEEEVTSSGDYNLEQLNETINRKLEKLNDWKHCIEGLDFAYTIKFGDKIEESKFSNIGTKHYLKSTTNFLSSKSILGNYINTELKSYFSYANYLNNKNPFPTEEVYSSEPVDIPKESLNKASIGFSEWVEYLKNEKIGSSTIFLFEKFDTSSSIGATGYEMYYSLFLTLNINVTPRIIDFIKSILKEFLFRVSNSKSIEIFETKEKSLRHTSLKSSLAAVMSRNMSHNIGSHVLNKLSSASAIQDFFSLQENKRFVRAMDSSKFREWNDEKDENKPNVVITDTVDFSFTGNTLSKEEESKHTFVTFYPTAKETDNIKQDFKPIYKLSPYFVDVNNNTTKEELARVFNDYLKKRMDFVADVATSNKALLNSNKYLFADIFRGFERNLLLLQNISGKEDKFSYQFQFQYCDGDTTSNYYQYDDDNNLVLENGVPKKNNDFLDPIVAVPNDVLGSQAFYIILENIIRNTAKHSGASNVTFTIKVEDLKKDDFYRVTVFDNVSFSGDDEEEKANKLKKLVVDRNISIAQDVLDENNEIRTAGWGTIEIKLAACYLSGLDMLEMDNKLYWPIGYPAFAKAEKKVKKIIEKEQKWEAIQNENPNLTKDDYIKSKSTQSYIDFLKHEGKCDPKNEEFEIQVEGKNTLLKVTECSDKLIRAFTKKGGKQVTRYPIVQAVDGNEKDKTRGFGYSFLMKKPKKLLIIDEKDHLKLETKDDEGNLIREHEDNVVTLKRLGIDILNKPEKESIYNHQFMIIVGDENSKHYGDWFNLPQERLFYFFKQKQFKEQGYSLKENLYLLGEDEFQLEKLKNIKDTFEERLIPQNGKILKFSILNIFKEIFYKKLFQRNPAFVPEIKFDDESVSSKIDLSYKNELKTPDNKNNIKIASFNHHGLSHTNFMNADYAEIYGSTSPIGLYIDSLSERVSGNPLNNYEIGIEFKYFLARGANTNVLVIDERIQQALKDNGCAVEAREKEYDENGKLIQGYDSYDLTYKQLFSKSGIEVIPEKINLDNVETNLNLNESNLKDFKNNILQYIKTITKDINFEFLVIHYGILEGLRDSSKKDTAASILTEIEKNIDSLNCKTIITSGRGFTPDIRNLDRFFISYSTISNFLLDPYFRSKSHLVNCLVQSRKTNIK